jgi:hypothetical protein
MSDDNVVPLRPMPQPPCDVGVTVPDDVAGQLMAFCERLNEGLNHVTSVLINVDARLRRLELALNKIEREKVTKSAIYNGQGERVR